MEYHKCCNTKRTGGLVVADVCTVQSYEWHSYLVDCPAPIRDVLYGWGWSRTEANVIDLQLEVIRHDLVFCHHHCRIHNVSCIPQSQELGLKQSHTITSIHWTSAHYMTVQNVTISSTPCVPAKTDRSCTQLFHDTLLYSKTTRFWASLQSCKNHCKHT